VAINYNEELQAAKERLITEYSQNKDLQGKYKDVDDYVEAKAFQAIDKMEFEASPDLKAEFKSFDIYSAYQAAYRNGLVKFVGRGTNGPTR